MQHIRFGRTFAGLPPLSRTMTFGLQCDERTSHAILDPPPTGHRLPRHRDVYRSGHAGDRGPHRGNSRPLVARERDKFIVATKCAGAVGPAPWQRGTSRKHVLAAIDASLARLGTDYVDLYRHTTSTPARQ